MPMSTTWSRASPSTPSCSAPSRPGVESDYAKWMLDDPRINFAISTRGGKPGVDHLGFQTDDAEELAELKARAAGGRPGAPRRRRDRPAATRAARSTGSPTRRASPGSTSTRSTASRCSASARRAGGRARPPAAPPAPARGKPVRSGQVGVVLLLTSTLADASMTTNVLILCTHNSARSVLAEGMLNHWAQGARARTCAPSAPAARRAAVNPHALEALGDAGVDTAGFRSKSWDEFAAPTRRRCASSSPSATARRPRPVRFWPGSPVKVHWGYPDPSDAPRAARRQARAFELTRQAIGYRMLQLLQLPLETMATPSCSAAWRRSPAADHDRDLPRKLLAEALGTALLLAVVIGSGIMAERLAGGNVGDRAAGQHAGHGRRPVRPDRGVRPGQRRALQPGGVSAVMALRGELAARRLRAVRRRPAARRGARRLAGARDVRR